MVKIYVRRIKNINIEFTIEDVPLRWRKDVQNILDAEKEGTEDVYV